MTSPTIYQTPGPWRESIAQGAETMDLWTKELEHVDGHKVNEYGVSYWTSRYWIVIFRTRNEVAL